jgi:antitoxin component YwqK of YwqJK toxin-antitoxin module
MLNLVLKIAVIQKICIFGLKLRPMKRILAAALIIISAATAVAQTKTVYYPGTQQKLSEGKLLGADATVLATDFESLPKDVQQQKMQNVTKDGKWSYYFLNGNISAEEHYNNGLMTGVWKGFYDNGKLNYEIDFATGKAVYYYENGNKQSEGKMLPGMVKDGKWTGWFENGTVNYDGTYVNGQKDGDWNFYNLQGKHTDIQTFSNGAEKGRKRL